MSEFYTQAGRKLEVSASLPATNDAPGYGAITGWVEAKKVGNYGDVGPEDAINTYTPLRNAEGEAVVLKAQGSRNYGDAAASLAFHEDNEAVFDVIAAAWLARVSFSVKDTMPNGDIWYYQCITPGLKLGGGGADDPMEMTTTFAVTTNIVKVKAGS
jgi:hypothetical protein